MSFKMTEDAPLMVTSVPAIVISTVSVRLPASAVTVIVRFDLLFCDVSTARAVPSARV